MRNLLDYSLSELEKIVTDLGFEKYRAKQLMDIICSGKHPGGNINLPKDMVDALLSHDYRFNTVEIAHTYKSKDGTTKYVYRLDDGNMIEGVFMGYKYGSSLCLSTQVGCKMNCAFCASGLNGFVRNLTAGEILGQYVAVNKLHGGSRQNRKINKIVLMGMGEPLDNYDNVVKFLKLINSSEGMNLGVRNISISTCGIPDKIRALADLGLDITLSLSLHAPSDEIRQKIMPIAKRYRIASILDAVDYYEAVTSRRVVIEYVLIDGINSSPEHAKLLANLLAGRKCLVNLIRLNEVKERGLKACDEDTENRFFHALRVNGVIATVRRTTGDDVSAACGQLRNHYIDIGE